MARDYKGLQGVIVDLRLTGGYKRLQGVTGGCRGLQGVTGGNKRLLGVTRDYRTL